MNTSSYTIRTADWPEDEDALRSIRRQVFIEEQQIPAELEWDGQDEDAIHVLALDSELSPIGTARLLPTGQIGRMAVLPEWREQGVGSALLRHLLQVQTKVPLSELYLNAQQSVISFYETQGFAVVGDIFFEAGIPHRRMHLIQAIELESYKPTSPVLRTSNRTWYLHTPEEAWEHSARMVAHARRLVCLLSHELDPAIYDRPEFVNAIKRLALTHRHAKVRVLIHDHQLILKHRHRLIELAHRLTTKIEVRKTDEQFKQKPETFLLADDCGYIHYNQKAGYTASVNFNNKAQVKLLLSEFDEIWDKSVRDVELLRLHI